jgi:GNAT superfamily N-acetyltransferase
MPPAPRRQAYRSPEPAIATSASAETTPPGVACEFATATALPTSRVTTARPSDAAASRIRSLRRRARDNVAMAAVSQALVDFANNLRQPAAPGVEVFVTPRYQITLQPDFPIPGPNSVTWIRCRPHEAGEVIREARATIAPRHLPVSWILDPGTEPPDFADYLEAHGVHPDPHGVESAVMVLPVDAPLQAPIIPGLEIHDALADLATFRRADASAAEAFGGASMGDDSEIIAMQDRRRRNLLAAGHRYWLLATVDGEPAGGGSMTVFPPRGATLNGGSVRPKFRGRGVYRALVAARLEIARRSGVEGLCVWGGQMSGPILARLGFETVGWRRFYVDTSTA